MQLNSVGAGVGTILLGLLLIAVALTTGEGFWGDDAIGNFIANGPGRFLLGAAGVGALIYGGVQMAGGDKRRE